MPLHQRTVFVLRATLAGQSTNAGCCCGRALHLCIVLLQSGSLGGSNARMPEYVRRFFQLPQMDMDYTLWQMLYLCISPSRVYRTTKYHKQTKNQWARDGAYTARSSLLMRLYSSLIFF